MTKIKNPNMGRPVINRHKVPMKYWRSLSNHARKVFNRTYENVGRQNLVNAHPKTVTVPRAAWKTVAWNAAWLAASYANK